MRDAVREPSRRDARGRLGGGACLPLRESLDQILSHFDVKRIRPHFAVKRADLKERLLAAPAIAAVGGPPSSTEFALAGYTRIEVNDRKEAAKLASALQKDATVWKTFFAPGRSRRRRRSRVKPPGGIAAAGEKGAEGKGGTVCDIEGPWKLDQEDFPANTPLIGATMIDDVGWRDHGRRFSGRS